MSDDKDCSDCRLLDEIREEHRQEIIELKATLKLALEAAELALKWHAYSCDVEGYAKAHDGWVPSLPWRRLTIAKAKIEETLKNG